MLPNCIFQVVPKWSYAAEYSQVVPEWFKAVKLHFQVVSEWSEAAKLHFQVVPEWFKAPLSCAWRTVTSGALPVLHEIPMEFVCHAIALLHATCGLHASLFCVAFLRLDEIVLTRFVID